MKFITHTIFLPKEAQTEQPAQQPQQQVPTPHPVQQKQYSSQQIMDWSKSLDPLFQRMIARMLSQNDSQEVQTLNKAVAGDVQSRQWLMNKFNEFKSSQPAQQQNPNQQNPNQQNPNQQNPNQQQENPNQQNPNQQDPNQQQEQGQGLQISDEAKARYGDKLISLWEKSQIEEVKSGRIQQKTIDYVVNLINKLEMDKDNLYSGIIKARYSSIRSVEKGEYENLVNSGKMPHDKNLDQYSGVDNNLIEVEDQGGWFYRLPKNRRQMGWSTKQKTVERVTGAVIGNVDLLKEMDNFVAKNKACYKTPESHHDWLSRQDPITVYFYPGFDPKALQEVAAILTKYSRTKYYDNVKLEGNDLAPGVANQPSTDMETINRLIDQASSIDPDFGKALRRKWPQKKRLNFLVKSNLSHPNHPTNYYRGPS
jgi:chemotaxis protein histidine kinase CheA